MYVENPQGALDAYCLDRYIPEPPSVATYPRGVILPLREFAHPDGESWELFLGGVADEHLNHIAGFASDHIKPNTNLSVVGGYAVEGEIEYCDCEVVYGGVAIHHFGHFLIDTLANWWYLAENDCGDTKIAINTKPSEQALAEYVYYFLACLGVKRETVIVANQKPRRYRNVIVPDQVMFRLSGYKDKAFAVFDKLRDRIKPGHVRKLYLSRTRWPKRDCLNEEYFETFYEKLGYEIVHPETLPIEEQLALVAGAEEIVCVSGTLDYFVLFARQNVALTILLRSNTLLGNHSPCFLQREANITYVSVCRNFLPIAHEAGPCLLFPTQQFCEYCRDNGWENQMAGADIRELVCEYIRMWADTYAIPWEINRIKDKTPQDFVALIGKYLLEERR
jgi:hypothetical protein